MYCDECSHMKDEENNVSRCEVNIAEMDYNDGEQLRTYWNSNGEDAECPAFFDIPSREDDPGYWFDKERKEQEEEAGL